MTTVPLPGVLSIVTVPPDWRQKPCTCDRPSPVPLPTALVVKKGSNTRDRTSGLIPCPLSLTAITTKAPLSPSGARPASSCLFSAEIVTAPSCGMASRAFNTMLSSASSNSLLSTWTIPRSRARANCQAHLRADRAAQDRFQLPDGGGRIDHFRIERLAA